MFTLIIIYTTIITTSFIGYAVYQEFKNIDNENLILNLSEANKTLADANSSLTEHNQILTDSVCNLNSDNDFLIKKIKKLKNENNDLLSVNKELNMLNFNEKKIQKQLELEKISGEDFVNYNFLFEKTPKELYKECNYTVELLPSNYELFETSLDLLNIELNNLNAMLVSGVFKVFSCLNEHCYSNYAHKESQIINHLTRAFINKITFFANDYCLNEAINSHNQINLPYNFKGRSRLFTVLESKNYISSDFWDAYYQKKWNYNNIYSDKIFNIKPFNFDDDNDI